MKTYKQIQSDYLKMYGRTISSCWIAEVKRELGLTKRIAYNRKDKTKYQKPIKSEEIRLGIKNIIQSKK